MNIGVVVPLRQSHLTLDEQTSLRHLRYSLDGFPLIALQPAGLDLRLPEFEAREFPAQYFASISAYSKLLFSTAFYEAFHDFDYILIYQLDCLVFSPDLARFCEMGYDYLGAPLFRDKADPTKGFSRVGNGGLSLRRVDSFLQVLNSTHIPSWKEVFRARLPDLCKFPLTYRWLKKMKIIRDARRGVDWYIQHYTLNEDLFWSDRANLFYPEFKVAPLDVALQFAFDAHPRYCFEQNHHRLPFGAHAWAKWDRAFWESYLLA